MTKTETLGRESDFGADAEMFLLLGDLARKPILPSSWLAGDFRETFLTLAELLRMSYRQSGNTLDDSAKRQ